MRLTTVTTISITAVNESIISPNWTVMPPSTTSQLKLGTGSSCPGAERRHKSAQIDRPIETEIAPMEIYPLSLGLPRNRVTSAIRTNANSGSRKISQTISYGMVTSITL
jgi:hypothetical protein